MYDVVADEVLVAAAAVLEVFLFLEEVVVFAATFFEEGVEGCEGCADGVVEVTEHRGGFEVGSGAG